MEISMRYNPHSSTGERVSNFLHAALAIPFGLLVTVGITLHMLVLLG
jgi:hypothetical protein